MSDKYKCMQCGEENDAKQMALVQDDDAAAHGVMMMVAMCINCTLGAPKEKEKLGALFSFVGIHLGSGNLRAPEIRIIDLGSGFR